MRDRKEDNGREGRAPLKRSLPLILLAVLIVLALQYVGPCGIYRF